MQDVSMQDEDRKGVCEVCIHHCRLDEGQLGRCKARGMRQGNSTCVNYAKVTSIALDPIEKKPLRKFYPGSKILSIGSFGCNLSCPFCQNHSISMKGEEESVCETLLPGDAARMAQNLINEGNIGLAYTYNEPLIGYEYVRDTAMEVRRLGMKNVVVTNGCFTEKVAGEVLPFIDALNIDLKSFHAETYRLLGGDLETVKKFILLAYAEAHIELTTLVVPGLNDTEEEMEALTGWVASIDPAIVLHISRFFPAWHMEQENPTEVRAVYRLAEIARRKLHNVYEGNC